MLNKVKNAIRWRSAHANREYLQPLLMRIKGAYYGVSTACSGGVNGGKHSIPGELIVSLTSYPPRFPTLHLTLKCLLNQTVRPDRIILWVADHEIGQLPKKILDMKAGGLLEIRSCVDSGPYDKIVPALEHFPYAFIVTADDDVYYKPHWLEILLSAWNGDLKNIVAHRVHRIKLDDNKEPAPYLDWKHDIGERQDSPLNFATGVGGVLYPPGALDKRVTDRDAFLKNCPKADDLWLFWMARLNGAKITKAPSDIQFVNWLASQKTALCYQNVNGAGNDVKIRNMIGSYGKDVFQGN